jgi:hypothetical protein
MQRQISRLTAARTLVDSTPWTNATGRIRTWGSGLEVANFQAFCRCEAELGPISGGGFGGYLRRLGTPSGHGCDVSLPTPS